MSEFVTSAADVPKTPFYVRAKDRFMSGWGKSAGKDNWVLLPCESYEEAQVVLENTRARSEMVDARIVCHIPRLVTRRDVTVSLFNREEADRWYTPGGFSK